MRVWGIGETKDYGIFHENNTAYPCSPWFVEGYADKIYRLQLEEGVTSYSDWLFANLINVNNLVLPDSLTKIGNWTFAKMNLSTTNVTIPKNVTTITGNPFPRVPITAIDIAEENTRFVSIDGVLYDDVEKRLITYPYGKADASYEVEEGTKHIGNHAFINNKYISEIVLPDSLEKISWGAFESVIEIEKIVIPPNVNEILKIAFWGTRNLKEGYIKSDNVQISDDRVFIGMPEHSIIYTTDKTIADMFVDTGDIETSNYDSSKTTVLYPPEITVQPQEIVTIFEGNRATFSVEAEAGNSGDVIYRWQYRENSLATWKDATNLQGSDYNTPTFTTVTTTEDMNGYEFRCVISDNAYPNVEMSEELLADKLISRVAVLEVVDPSNIILSPSTGKWTNHDVIVTVTWPGTELIKEIKIGTDGEWQVYDDSTVIISENTTIYARVSDGVSVGDAVSLSITNIDKDKPILSVEDIVYPNKATITASDAASGIEAWRITDEPSDISVDWREVNVAKDLVIDDTVTRDAGTYYAFVRDVAGNISEAFEFEIDKGTITGSVAIIGEARQGEILEVDVSGIIPNECEYTYQWWYSSDANATSGTDIAGANDIKYEITDDMLGKYIGVTVVAKATNYYDKAYTCITTSSVIADTVPPQLRKLSVTNLSEGEYAAGTLVEFTAEWSEKIDITNSTTPKLSIVIGDGEAILLDDGIWVDNTTTKYTYVIKLEDLGEFFVESFVGRLQDLRGNAGDIESAEFSGNRIVARTGVMTGYGNTILYYTRLSEAIEKAPATYVKFIMILDEEIYDSIVVPVTRNIGLELNGKDLTFVLSESGDELRSGIINRGTLDIFDNAAGMISVEGDASKLCGIYNDGTITLNEVNILAVTDFDIVYGTFNRGNMKIIDGNITALEMDNEGISTAVYSEGGVLQIGENDGTIQLDIPYIYGTENGIYTKNSLLEFYDGVVEGNINSSVVASNITTPEDYSLVKSITGNRERSSIGVDNTPPVLTIVNLTPEWTSESTLISVYAEDKQSGISTLKFEGNKMDYSGVAITLEVTENGTYTFEAVDFAGNSTVGTIDIGNIDRVAPVIHEVTYDGITSSTTAVINVSVSDDLSGVFGYAISTVDREPTTWQRVSSPNTTMTLDIEIDENDTYYLFVRDVVGNYTMYHETIVIENIDVRAPVIESLTIREDGNNYVNSSMIIMDIEATDDIGVKEVLVSNTPLGFSEVRNSDEWVPYSEEILWTLPIGDDTYTVYVWVKDEVGRVSQCVQASIRLFAQYIGNNGDNETSLRVLIRDTLFKSSETLEAGELKLRTKKDGNITHEGAFGEYISIDAAPTIYGPIQIGHEEQTGRYYTINISDVEGEGLIYLVLADDSMEDIPGNEAGGTEVATDVIIELNKPIVSVTSTEIVAADLDGYLMPIIKINGQSVKLTNGRISLEDLATKYNITLTAGDKIEAADRCGNTTIYTY